MSDEAKLGDLSRLFRADVDFSALLDVFSVEVEQVKLGCSPRAIALLDLDKSYNVSIEVVRSFKRS